MRKGCRKRLRKVRRTACLAHPRFHPKASFANFRRHSPQALRKNCTESFARGIAERPPQCASAREAGARQLAALRRSPMALALGGLARAQHSCSDTKPLQESIAFSPSLALVCLPSPLLCFLPPPFSLHLLIVCIPLQPCIHRAPTFGPKLSPPPGHIFGGQHGVTLSGALVWPKRSKRKKPSSAPMLFRKRLGHNCCTAGLHCARPLRRPSSPTAAGPSRGLAMSLAHTGAACRSASQAGPCP